MDFYTAIQKRKSIRKYSGTEIGSSQFDAIKQYISALQRFDNSIRTSIKIVKRDGMAEYFQSIGSVIAPYYLVFLSEKSPVCQENIGFLGEQMAVFFASAGIGACWLGRLEPKKTSFELPYVISMAFGYAEGSIYRESPKEFIRKPMDEICLKTPQDDFMAKAAEAVRLAPSALNRQPWRIEPEGNAIHFYCEQPAFLTPINSVSVKGLIPGAILKKLQGISCGIALSHIMMYAASQGRDIIFEKLPERENSHRKLTYIITARMR